MDDKITQAAANFNVFVMLSSQFIDCYGLMVQGLEEPRIFFGSIFPPCTIPLDIVCWDQLIKPLLQDSPL